MIYRISKGRSEILGVACGQQRCGEGAGGRGSGMVNKSHGEIRTWECISVASSTIYP